MRQTVIKNPWQNLAAGNSTFAALPAASSCSPTLTQPAGDFIINLPGVMQNEGPSWLDLIIHGSSTGTSSFGFRVLGWTPTKQFGPLAGSESVPLWISQHLCEGTGTIGTMGGLSSYSVPSSDSFCTNMAITLGNSLSDAGVHSPNNNYPASLRMATEGAQLIQVQLASGVAGTTLNGLWRTE